MFRFVFHLFCFNDFDMLVGVELDGFGVEIGCEHHMFAHCSLFDFVNLYYGHFY